MANQEIKKAGSSSSNPGEEYSYPYPYPYPYPLGVCVTNFVSVKLSGRDMYDVWETQMSCLLESHDMLCFVNTNPPAEKVGEWRRSDALEKGWILGSLSDQTLNFIVKTIPKEDLTSKNVWHKLKTCYGPLPPPAAAGLIMELVSEHVISPVVQSLITHITKHVGYVTSSTKHVADMRSKIKVLEGTFNDVNNHMERNKMNNREIPARVPGWSNEVKKIMENFGNISFDVSGCLNLKKRYQVGRNAFKTFKEIERLNSEGEKFAWSDAIIPLGRVDSKPPISTSAPCQSGEIIQNDFKSRDKAFKDTLTYLQQDASTNQLIALCGMGGVGKTTMMERLKNVARDKKMFNLIVKVVIGQSHNILSVQNDIGFYLGDPDLPNASTSVRADYLCEKFKKNSQDNKKILVILDDVWENFELKNIGLTSPLPKTIKLLLTSRDRSICEKIVIDANSDLQVVKIGVLEEVEARNFFFGITGVLEEHDHGLYQIGCDIVKKCGCLPLAIKLIASTLKSKEECVWKSRLDRLKNNDLDKDVQEIIKISYEHIEDEEDKQIFLHCSLFPEDYNISIEDLTRYTWGLKLLKDVSTLREARDRIQTCVHKLINANLLINSDRVGCVKVHDLVLAFLLGRVSKGVPAWIINHGDISTWGRGETSESCKNMSLTCKGL